MEYQAFIYDFDKYSEDPSSKPVDTTMITADSKEEASDKAHVLGEQLCPKLRRYVVVSEIKH